MLALCGMLRTFECNKWVLLTEVDLDRSFSIKCCFVQWIWKSRHRATMINQVCSILSLVTFNKRSYVWHFISIGLAAEYTQQREWKTSARHKIRMYIFACYTHFCFSRVSLRMGLRFGELNFVRVQIENRQARERKLLYTVWICWAQHRAMSEKCALLMTYSISFGIMSTGIPWAFRWFFNLFQLVWRLRNFCHLHRLYHFRLFKLDNISAEIENNTNQSKLVCSIHFVTLATDTES